MFQRIVILLLFFVSNTLVFAQKPKTVIVSTVQEFIRAIESNVTIRLKESKYMISDHSPSTENVNAFFRSVGNGYELEISNIKNLKIIGAGVRTSKFVSQTLDASVLHFKNCENITLENVEIGYGISKNAGKGSILQYSNSKNIQLNNVALLGNGFEGLLLNQVVGAKFQNISIRACTNSILTLNSSRNIEFINARITQNQTLNGINVFESENIIFTNCLIDMNKSGVGTQLNNYALLNVLPILGVDKHLVTFRKCTIEDNYSPYLCHSSSTILVEDSEMNSSNLFEKGYSMFR